MQNRRIIACILAGGLSRRMGTDKALLRDSQQQNQLQRACTVIQPLIGAGVIQQTVISRAFNPEEQQQLGCEFIPDLVEEKGPLGAIYSLVQALKNQCDFLLLLPVDLPLIQTSNLTELISEGLKNRSACFYNNHFLPLFLPLSKQLIQYLEMQLNSDEGDLSVRALLTKLSSQVISYNDDEKFLTNANTPEQWLAIQKQI